MTWLFLGGAIVSEVAATLSLKAASAGKNAWYAAVGTGYLLAFAFLTVALRGGMPLGIAYGVWAATGVAATAVLSRVIFKEPLTPTMLAGIAMIASGVLLIEVGAAH
ncbi:MAG: SMR family transporter [Actinomycetaceae bacterium]|nr:SMR family transporter [Actinomycetaceae bacterium]